MEPPAGELAWLSSDIHNILLGLVPAPVKGRLILASRANTFVFAGNKDFWHSLFLESGHYLSDDFSAPTYSAADVRHALNRCSNSLRNLSPSSSVARLPMKRLYGIASWLTNSSSSYSISAQFTSKQSGFRAKLYEEYSNGSFTDRNDIETVFMDSVGGGNGAQVQYDTVAVRQTTLAASIGPGLLRVYTPDYSASKTRAQMGLYRLSEVSGEAALELDFSASVAACFPPRLPGVLQESFHVVVPQDMGRNPLYAAVAAVKINGKAEYCLSVLDVTSRAVLLSNVLLEIPDAPVVDLFRNRFYQSSSTLIVGRKLPEERMSEVFLFDLRGRLSKPDGRLVPTHTTRLHSSPSLSGVFVDCGLLVCVGDTHSVIFRLEDIRYLEPAHERPEKALATPFWDIQTGSNSSASMCGRLLAVSSGWGQAPIRVFDVLERCQLVVLPWCIQASFVDSTSMLLAAHGSVFRLSLFSDAATPVETLAQAPDAEFLEIGVFSDGKASGSSLASGAKRAAPKRALVRVRACEFEADVCRLLGVASFEHAHKIRTQVTSV